MFEREAHFPLAITSMDDEGLVAGLRWCRGHLTDGERLTVWTRLKSNLGNNQLLNQFVARTQGVEHVTARGGALVRRRGSVLMAWPDPGDIAEFAGSSTNFITALCVVAWNEDLLRPWVTFARPELLGDTSAWDVPTPGLDPVVEEGMKNLTRTINHSNTIAGGYEKDDVVSTLLALHDAGYLLDGTALVGWAVAHGWTGNNPALLGKYVTSINKGSRPQVLGRFKPNLIDYLQGEARKATEE